MAVGLRQDINFPAISPNGHKRDGRLLVEPRFEQVTEKHVVGMKVKMSLVNNKTNLLWQGFMPRRTEINHVANTNLYSIEIYGPDFFNPFNPNVEFEKWAAVEVSPVETIPAGMETIVIPPGLYAVFIHKGPPSLGPKTYQYILGTWIPGSPYALDTRPHFAVMGEKYKHDDPDSEEEMWVPILLKDQ
jgi:AraC family transcriptional regulator